MLTFRKLLFFLEAIIRRKFRLVAFFGFLLIAVLILLGFLSRATFRPTITEGIIGVYEEGNLPSTVTNLISKSLVKMDETGTPIPDLAESWDATDEAKEYKIKLKNGLIWSDNTPVKSSEIKIDIPDVTLEYPDDSMLLFKISDPFSPFLSLLTRPVLKNRDLVGIGPYKVDSVKKEGLYIKRMNLSPVGENDLPKIVLKFYPNEKIAKNALKIGEVQALFDVTDTTGLDGKTISQFGKPTFRQIVTIFYNTADPILSDENFRLALSFGAPSIEGEIESKTSIPPNSWAFNSDVKDFLDNLEQAKASLSKVQKGKSDQITLTATSSLASVGERVVEEWKKLGVNAVLRTESGIPQNFQALLITQNIPSDPDQYSLWHSTQQGTNISKISTPRIDKDLEDGRKTLDLEVRKARYQDFQKVLLDRAPATFLYFPKYNVVFLKKVEKELKKVLDLQLQGI